MINDGFKLSSLFNMTTSYYESPRRYEKLKITVDAGTNSTHTVLLSRPPSTPKPDAVSVDLKSMTWENTKISSLQDLMFSITLYQGTFVYKGVTYYIPISSNSTVSNFNFNINPTNGTLSFTISGANGTSGFCNVTIPKALLDVNVPTEWMIKVDGKIVTANCTITPFAGYTYIYIPYPHSIHTISVIGTEPVSEMSPNILPQVLTLTTLIAAIVIIVTQRRKIGRIKTKSLNFAHEMIKSFSNLRRR